MTSGLQSKASGVLDKITAPLNNGIEKVKQGVENMEKDHNEIDELISKDNEEVDKVYGEAMDAYQKIEPKNGNITIDEFNSFYDKDRQLIIDIKNMTDELNERKQHTDLIGRAKIDAEILSFGGKAISSTGKLVGLVGSLRRNLKKQQQQLFGEIDAAKANGQLSNEQKQQFETRLKDLAQKIRNHKQNMASRMTPTLKVLQIAFKMELDYFEKMATETDQKANQLQ